MAGDSVEIRLRAVEPEDAELMWLAENDEDCSDTSDYTAPLSRRQLEEYAFAYDADPFRAGQLRLIVECAGQAIGIIDLYDISLRDMTAWIGIYIAGAWRGRGVGGAALELMERRAFGRMGLMALGARVIEDNEASRRLFVGSGWKECGCLPGWRRCSDGQRRGVLQYVKRCP